MGYLSQARHRFFLRRNPSDVTKASKYHSSNSPKTVDPPRLSNHFHTCNSKGPKNGTHLVRIKGKVFQCWLVVPFGFNTPQGFARQCGCQGRDPQSSQMTTNQLKTAGVPFCHKHVGFGVHPKVFISCYFGIWIITHHLMRIHRGCR